MKRKGIAIPYVVWMAVIYVVINLVTDLIYCFLDPRIRLGGEEVQ